MIRSCEALPKTWSAMLRWLGVPRSWDRLPQSRRAPILAATARSVAISRPGDLARHVRRIGGATRLVKDTHIAFGGSSVGARFRHGASGPNCPCLDQGRGYSAGPRPTGSQEDRFYVSTLPAVAVRPRLTHKNKCCVFESLVGSRVAPHSIHAIWERDRGMHGV